MPGSCSTKIEKKGKEKKRKGGERDFVPSPHSASLLPTAIITVKRKKKKKKKKKKKGKTMELGRQAAGR